MSYNILYAVSSLGLGHATRSLPVIKHFLKDKNNKIIIVSTGNALNFLKTELLGIKKVKFYDLKDYPPLQRGKGLRLYSYLIKDALDTVFIINNEHKICENLVEKEKIDFIISDVRYGFFSKNVPSFAIIHQVGLILPKYFKVFSPLVDYFQFDSLKKFDLMLIPDFPSETKNLSGELAHNRLTKKLNHEYVGILSSYNHVKSKKDIDYYFIISGFLKDTKESFISKLIEQSKSIRGKKVFTLGDTKNNYHKIDKNNNLEVHSYVSGKLKNDLMNRANTIISRSGYTTIMDLVELDKKGILAPTLNQTEQEYLAKYLDKKGYFTSFNAEKEFDLKNLIKKADKVKNFQAPWKTKETLKRIDSLIKQYLK